MLGGTEVGQGAKTVLAQIGAETLNLPVEDIVFVNEDTSQMPDSGTAAASRQTYNTGNAIKIACENFRDKLKELAKEHLGLNSVYGLKMENGKIYLEIFPQKTVSFKELFEAFGNEDIEVEGEFVAKR